MKEISFSTKADRIKIITGLWTLLRYANVGEYFLGSLSVGIPDDSKPNDEEIIETIVDNDEEFELWLNMYLRRCTLASLDGGFFGLLRNEKSTMELTKEDLEL